MWSERKIRKLSMWAWDKAISFQLWKNQYLKYITISTIKIFHFLRFTERSNIQLYIFIINLFRYHKSNTN